MTTQRATVLEELQALGFDSQADYAEHQRMLAKADQLYKSQSLLVADGDWCLLQR